MSTIAINQEALAHYRKVRDFNKKYNALDETSHTQNFDDDASWISASSQSVRSFSTDDWIMDSPTVSPIHTRGRKRLSKYHGEHNMKSLKEKSPNSIDRSLRNQQWLGSPVSVGKSRRSWKPKNPADMAQFMLKNEDA